MKRLAAFCVLISAPALASADVILEFWGSVDWVVGGTQQRGDQIHGSMRIADLSTPRDWQPSENEGAYDWNDQSCERNCPAVLGQSSFVADDSLLIGESQDHAWAIDGTAIGGDTWDSFGASNVEYAGSNTVARFLSLSAPIDFIFGQGLAQQFDLDIAGSGGSADFTVNDQVDGVSNFFGAALSRIRASIVGASPQSCHAT